MNQHAGSIPCDSYILIVIRKSVFIECPTTDDDFAGFFVHYFPSHVNVNTGVHGIRELGDPPNYLSIGFFVGLENIQRNDICVPLTTILYITLKILNKFID